MAGLVIRPRSRILRGHDWVFATEVLKVFGNPADGSVVSLKDARDKMLGSAIYNSRSQIVARRFSRRRQDLDADFFQRRIRLAADLRSRSGCRGDLHRAVWSESDGLPGVILDRYGDTAVLQTLTLAMDQQKAVIALAAMEVLGLRGVVERNDAPIRAAEGMEPVTGILAGDPTPQFTFDLDGVEFTADLLAGQKTGFYLDQISNYAAIAAHAKGRRVLDCFSNQGGFALACARAGASEVVAVDASADCVAQIDANAARNHLTVRAIRRDVFDFLKHAPQSGIEPDFIILDPPSFTKGKGRVHDALRGYRDLHLRAASLLRPGGLMATFSCSHHITAAALLESAQEGLFDAGKSARVLAELYQAPDHPRVVHLPETSYLKGFLLEMLPGR